jgi:hypothetical protein
MKPRQTRKFRNDTYSQIELLSVCANVACQVAVREGGRAKPDWPEFWTLFGMRGAADLWL